jgi:hypothetical protein
VAGVVLVEGQLPFVAAGEVSADQDEGLPAFRLHDHVF